MLLIIYKSKHLQLFFNLWFSFISFGISFPKGEGGPTKLLFWMLLEKDDLLFIWEIIWRVALLSKNTLELLEDRDMGLMSSILLQDNIVRLILKIFEQTKLWEGKWFFDNIFKIGRGIECCESKEQMKAPEILDHNLMELSYDPLKMRFPLVKNKLNSHNLNGLRNFLITLLTFYPII